MDRPGEQLWRSYINPQMVRLLRALDFGRRFVRAEGTTVYDDSGRGYADFLSGFGVHNIGHNHPALCAALKRAIDSGRPSMLNIDASEAAGELARDLCEAMHPSLCRVAFANSGSEAVEIAIRAARAATGRTVLISCDNAFHGLTSGALTLMGSAEHRSLFGASSAVVRFVAYGDPHSLRKVVESHRPAAFFVEPVQAEGGIRVPPRDYLREAGEICRRHGSLLVVDEIQTGIGRCGRMFATDFETVRPDVVLVGKGLSGGMVPLSAAIMTDRVWRKAFGGPVSCQMATTTFAGGLLAMAAGREVMRIVRDEGLADRARQRGERLLDGLRGLAGKFPMIEEVRGQGLLTGIRFRRGDGLIAKAIPRWARPGLYAQVVSALLLRDHAIITQPCSLDPTVLRFEPPLVIGEQEIARLLDALDSVLRACPTYSAAAWAAIWRSVFGGRL